MAGAWVDLLVRSSMTGPREAIGSAIGAVWAPAIAAIAKARHARMFHPEGHTFGGRAEAVAGPYEALGTALAGRVLARLSAALWKQEIERFDVLGLALRFRPGTGPALGADAREGDQDLLTATIRSPLTMLASPLFTDASDFIGNRYWAVSPFRHQVGRIELRLTPIDPPEAEGTRIERLYAAIATGRVGWWLEARRTLTFGWHRAARVMLDAPADIDQAALRFDPFRAGAGLQPVGLVHAIRRAAYAASQHARAATNA